MASLGIWVVRVWVRLIFATLGFGSVAEFRWLPGFIALLWDWYNIASWGAGLGSGDWFGCKLVVWVAFLG